MSSDLTDFFTLVRDIERHMGATADDSDASRFAIVGQDGPAASEAVKFRSAQGLGFSDGAIKTGSLTAGRQEVWVHFMGLAGPAGVLPQHYSRLLMERQRLRDSTLADFLDIFNHRLVSLFYRGWIKYRLPRQADLHSSLQVPDPFSRTLSSLCGQRGDGAYKASLFYSGQLSRSVRSSVALEDILSDFLELPVRVHNFVGQWLTIRPHDRLRIGRHGRGSNNLLGAGVLPGRRCWDVQSRIAIEIGEMDTRTYASIRRGTDTFSELEQLIRLYVPTQISVDIKLKFRDHSDSLPTLGGGAQLGRTCWLKPTAEQGLMVEKIRID